MSKSAIEKLPSEILLKIFKYCLNTSDSIWYEQCKEYETQPDYNIRKICMNMRQIRLVCNRFNDVSKDVTLIKKLIIDCDALKNKKNTDYILDTILRSKCLTHLYINIATNQRESLLLFAIQSCPKLSHLFISGKDDKIDEDVDYDDEEYDSEEDEFKKIQLSDVCIASICEFAKNLQFLQLDLWKQSTEMCRRLTKLENLKELRLDTILDEVLIEIGRGCKKP